MGAWYKPAVVTWLALSVAAIVISSLATDGSDASNDLPLWVTLGTIGTGMVAILSYTMWGLVRPRDQDPVTPSDDGGIPVTTDELIAALALGPVAPRGRAPDVAVWTVGLAGLLVISVIVSMGLYVGGLESRWLAAGPVGIAVIGAVAIPLVLRGSRKAGDEWLEPLGLRIERMATPILVPEVGGGLAQQVHGPTSMRGERHGRRVAVDVAAQGSLTHVQAPVPPFTAEERDRSLVTDAGGAIGEALAGLPAHPRWRRVKVTGGPDGILVERKAMFGVADPLWLDDLWLAERLARAAG